MLPISIDDGPSRWKKAQHRKRNNLTKANAVLLVVAPWSMLSDADENRLEVGWTKAVCPCQARGGNSTIATCVLKTCVLFLEEPKQRPRTPHNEDRAGIRSKTSLPHKSMLGT